ncbi:MAG: caspase family protein, partial [Cyanobacteria bacterium]|nr:caspase family protein [Cyanobacteriota bacterium]
PLQVVYAELSLKHLPATSHTAIVAGSSSTAIVADRKATVPGGGAAAPIQLPDGSPTTTTVATTSTAATTTTATTASTSSESLLPPSTPSTAPALATATGPASTGTQINRPITDKWAVIVGLSKYKDSSMNLKAPRKDSEAFAEFLINDAGFAQSHVIKIYDKDASREKIMSTLEELGRRMRPDDLFVFYANCHGSSTQKDGGNYLLLWDYGGSMKKQLLMQELSQTLKTKVPSERIVVIVQACHSGFVKDANFPSPEAVSKDLMGVGRIVATACLGSESSWVYPRGGVFTRALIPNLRKYPKLKEALTHTRDAVIAATEDDKLSQQMHPIIKYDLWTGDDAVLMAVPTAPQP